MEFKKFFAEDNILLATALIVVILIGSILISFIACITGCSVNQNIELTKEDFYQLAVKRGLSEENLTKEEILKSGKIFYLDENFTKQEIPMDLSKENYSIPFIQGQIIPVIFQFDTSTVKSIKTGILYPVLTEKNVHSAFATEIYLRMFLESTSEKEKINEFLSFFNWQKFYQSLLKFEAPYLLDADLICSDIATGQFNSFSLKLK